MARILLLFCLCNICWADSFLSEEDIALFYERGFAICKQAVAKEELKRLDRYCSKVIEKAFEEIKNAPILQELQARSLDGSQLVFKKDPEPKILRVVGVGGAEPALLSVLASEKMIATFFDLLGVEAIEHLICQFHPKLPDDGVSFIQHRDIDHRRRFDSNWVDLNGRGSYAIAILAIDPMSPENGGLMLDLSSFGDQEGVFAAELEPGDLLFIHPEIVHWSEPNQSNRSRRTLLTGFCVYGANSKAYPGESVNNCFLKTDSSVLRIPAPWKGSFVSQIGQH